MDGGKIGVAFQIHVLRAFGQRHAFLLNATKHRVQFVVHDPVFGNKDLEIAKAGVDDDFEVLVFESDLIQIDAHGTKRRRQVHFFNGVSPQVMGRGIERAFDFDDFVFRVVKIHIARVGACRRDAWLAENADEHEHRGERDRSKREEPKSQRVFPNQKQDDARDEHAAPVLFPAAFHKQQHEEDRNGDFPQKAGQMENAETIQDHENRAHDKERTPYPVFISVVIHNTFSFPPVSL